VPTATAVPTATPAPVVPNPLAPWPAAAAIVAGLAGLGAIVFVQLRRMRRPKMRSLAIVTPLEASIAVAGRPVTFAAVTQPPELAANVRWSVETQPGAPDAHGIGPSFTYTFAETGVEQVVARLDGAGLACDVVVYLFKTPTGGSTLADLLRSEPPKISRSVESLRRYGASAVEPGRAS
jgi:hypothetical protein